MEDYVLLSKEETFGCTEQRSISCKILMVEICTESFWINVDKTMKPLQIKRS